MNKSVRLIRLHRIYRMTKLVKFMRMFNFRKQSKLYEKFYFMLKLHSGIYPYKNIYIFRANASTVCFDSDGIFYAFFCLCLVFCG